MEAREQIRALMAQHDVSYRKLAEKVHMDDKTLYYRLNSAKGEDIGMIMYQQIMDALDDLGVKLNCGGDTCKSLIEITLHANTKIGRELSDLNQEVQRDIADNVITPIEAVQILNRIDNMQKEFNENFEKIRKLLCRQ